MRNTFARLNVIHVDDITEDLQVTQTLIGNDERWNYNSIVRSWEAVEVIPAMQPIPDVVMVDINMPNMDGFSLVSELQQHPQLRDTKFVVVSSTEDRRELEAFHELGVELFVHKAFDLSTYRSALIAALEQCMR